MNKEVEYLQKKEINSYTKFIKDVFDYDIEEENINKLIKNNIVLVIKNHDKIIASAILEERFDYIK